MTLTRISTALLLTLIFTPFSASAKQSSLSVSTKQPVLAGSIPQGAQRVPVLTVGLTASCGGNVILTSLTFKHSGLGSPADILRIYALDGISRVSRVASVSSTYPSTIRFAPYVIPACKTVSLSIAADLARQASAGGEHRFDLVSVSANAPVTISTGRSTASPLTITPHATTPAVTADFKPMTGEFNYGGGQIVAKLLLTSASSADQAITAITFTNDGSAQNADLQNLSLESSGGSRLSDVIPQMTGRTVRITFSTPLALNAHDAKLVQLRADIRASRSHSISWTIDQPSDIEARETN